MNYSYYYVWLLKNFESIDLNHFKKYILNAICYEKWRKAKNLHACFEEIRNGFVKANNKLLYFFKFRSERRMWVKIQNICCLNVLVCWHEWYRHYGESRILSCLKMPILPSKMSTYLKRSDINLSKNSWTLRP